MYEAYGLLFDWDPEKARTNLARHGVSFEEAATVFGDPQALYGEDTEHSDAEEREAVTGTSDRQRVLTVTFTERETMEQQSNGQTRTVVIRIITAARATRRERQNYEEE